MTIEDQLSALAVAAPTEVGDRALVGVGLADEYITRSSPLGPIYVAYNGLGVSSVSIERSPGEFEDYFRRRIGRPLRPGRRLPEPVERHLDTAIEQGTPGRLPVDLRSVSDFQRRVLTETATIPRGEVRPYGWIAQRIGTPAAVRAVGTALATNPIPLIIPCHRVVRTDGTFGRYSLGTDDNKPRLLAAEGLDVTEHQRLASRGVRYLGSDSTRIFCHPTCHAARRITAQHRVEFRVERSAADAGYRPCRVCRPKSS